MQRKVYQNSTNNLKKTIKRLPEYHVPGYNLTQSEVKTIDFYKEFNRPGLNYYSAIYKLGDKKSNLHSLRFNFSLSVVK